MRTPKHAETLRDDSYATYCEVNEEIHGVSDESCACCGKPRSQERRHDRDHGHLKGDAAFGKPRGLLCVKCNILMPRDLDVVHAAFVTAYLRRVDAFYRREAMELVE